MDRNREIRRFKPLPFRLILLLFLLLRASTATAAAIRQEPQTGQPEVSDEPSSEKTGTLLLYVRSWWVVGITVASALPWAVVAVLDAIDSSYRTASMIQNRLIMSTCCLLLAYISGIMFLVVLSVNIVNGIEAGRHDEVATVLVLLIFNLWHVARNARGWMQFFALKKLTPFFQGVQRYLAVSAGRDPNDTHVCVQGLTRLRISNRLIDNDWNQSTPFLSPFYKIRCSFGGISPGVASPGIASRVMNRGGTERQPTFGGHRAADSFGDPAALPALVPDKTEEAWAVAAWRAWWTQDTGLLHWQVNNLSAPESFRCDKEHRKPNVENLLTRQRGPSWPTDRPVIDTKSEGQPTVTTREQWANCLLTYGTAEGQQDTHGECPSSVVNFNTAAGIAVVVREKTRFPPNRMSSLWYTTARFEELYEEKAQEVRKMSEFRDVLFPSWTSWLNIAQDVGTHLSRPVYLSDSYLINFAGELASASLIVVRYPEKYRKLVDQIYEDGLDARWTFGWSGLLACFTQLWTKERIHIAMLNGLSLLALNSGQEVEHIDPNVRSMLYGYAAFAVSTRAVGKRIAEDRKVELLRRYTTESGKTCRGSGVCATRLACSILKIPAEASHMDGLPAFATGWASEYMEFKPGNQKPEHGESHDDVEMKHGSSNAWRYPHSHI